MIDQQLSWSIDVVLCSLSPEASDHLMFIVFIDDKLEEKNCATTTTTKTSFMTTVITISCNNNNKNNNNNNININNNNNKFIDL